MTTMQPKTIETFDPDGNESRVQLVAESAAIAKKGMYTASAMSLPLAYPYGDARLRDWVTHQLPRDRRIDRGGRNKVLVRQHVVRRFPHLPYVAAKNLLAVILSWLHSRSHAPRRTWVDKGASS